MNRMKRQLSDANNPPVGEFWVRVKRKGKGHQVSTNHTKLVPYDKGVRMIANEEISPSGQRTPRESKYFAVPL